MQTEDEKEWVDVNPATLFAPSFEIIQIFKKTATPLYQYSCLITGEDKFSAGKTEFSSEELSRIAKLHDGILSINPIPDQPKSLVMKVLESEGDSIRMLMNNIQLLIFVAHYYDPKMPVSPQSIAVKRLLDFIEKTDLSSETNQKSALELINQQTTEGGFKFNKMLTSLSEKIKPPPAAKKTWW